MYIGNKKVNFGTPTAPVYPEFPQNLVRLRHEHGMTQAQLANALLVTPETVFCWEHGRIPRYGILLEISKLFDTSIPALLGRIADQHYPKGTVKKKWVVDGDDLIEK